MESSGTVEKTARISTERRQDQCRECRCPIKASGVIDDLGDVVFQMHGVAPDEVAFSPHLPDLTQKSFGEALAARAAAEHQNITAEKPRISTKLHRRLAPQTRAVEQDRFEREKLQCGTRSDRQRLADRRRWPHLRRSGAARGLAGKDRCHGWSDVRIQDSAGRTARQFQRAPQWRRRVKAAVGQPSIGPKKMRAG